MGTNRLKLVTDRVVDGILDKGHINFVERLVDGEKEKWAVEIAFNLENTQAD
jgi:hypothetical protein